MKSSSTTIDNISLSIGVPQLTEATPYEVRLTLDGALAFADKYLPDDMPF